MQVLRFSAIFAIVCTFIGGRVLSSEDSRTFIKVESLTPVGFNTKGHDMCPVKYRDGLVFSSDGRSRKESGAVRGHFLELMYVPFVNGKLKGVPELFDDKFISAFHSGPATFSSEEDVIFLSRNMQTNINYGPGLNPLNILYAEKNGDTWGKLRNFAFNSKTYSVSHPALSLDGKRLYFSSDMPEGYGEADIYYTELKDGGWSEPVNLGDKINTAGRDMFPYIDSNNNLYIASEGHGGHGGLDIFFCGNIYEGEMKVCNLGSDINSSSDDFGFLEINDYEHVLFASNRPGGKGENDIYIAKPIRSMSSTVNKSFAELLADKALLNIVKDVIPAAKTSTSNDSSFVYASEVVDIEPSYLLSGQVVNDFTGKPEAGTKVELIADGEVLHTIVADHDGKYELNVDHLTLYKVHLSKQDLFSHNDYFIYSHAGNGRNSLISNVRYSGFSKETDDYNINPVVKQPESVDSYFVEGSLFADGSRALLKVGSVSPAGFNTKGQDMCPVKYKDGLVFSSDGRSRRKRGAVRGNFLELMYVPFENGKVNGTPELFNDRFFSAFHDGPATFSNEEDVIFLSRNMQTNINYGTGLNPLSILYSEKIGDKWGEPRNFAFNSKTYSVSHPALTPNGKRLYFSSDMPGGYGEADIYYTELKDGGWSEPVNVGDKINTPERDMFPYVDNNNNLYIASEGHGGQGGLDIFLCGNIYEKDMKVRNLGNDINSSADDFGFLEINNYEHILFASNRPGGKGENDIYIANPIRSISGTVVNSLTELPVDDASVMIMKDGALVARTATSNDGSFVYPTDDGGEYEVRIEKKGFNLASHNVDAQLFDVTSKIVAIDPSYMLTGQVVNDITGKPEAGTKVELIANGEVLNTIVADHNGKYELSVDDLTLYKINLSKQGLFDHNDYFIYSYVGNGRNTLINKVSYHGIQRYQASQDYQAIQDHQASQDHQVSQRQQASQNYAHLSEVFFRFDSYSLDDRSIEKLKELLLMAKDSPRAKLILSSHADIRGSYNYNIKLTEKRSESVARFFVERGFPADKIVVRSFGNLKARNSGYSNANSSKMKHRNYRRTDVFLVIS